MGRSADSSEFYEYRLTDYLERFFERNGISFSRQPIAPKRENIVASVPGDPPPEHGGGLLLLEAHQDTVPVDGMTIPPFDPQIRDGRLYGRGSCDIKGGMAAMLAVMARLSQEPPSPRPTVVMACTVNEEHGFTGAIGLSRLWSGEEQQPSEICPLLPRRPDAAIVAEPTNLNVVVAHKGMVRWRCHTTGRGTQLATRTWRECHFSDGQGTRLLGTLSAADSRHTRRTPAVWSPHAQRGFDQGGHEREHGARSLHDRNRPPACARRRSERRLETRSRIRRLRNRLDRVRYPRSAAHAQSRTATQAIARWLLP